MLCFFLKQNFSCYQEFFKSKDCTVPNFQFPFLQETPTLQNQFLLLFEKNNPCILLQNESFSQIGLKKFIDSFISFDIHQQQVMRN